MPDDYKPSPIMKYFKYDHLPLPAQESSKPFCLLAEKIDRQTATDPAEKATALRKLLEAKDAAVRAFLPA